MSHDAAAPKSRWLFERWAEMDSWISNQAAADDSKV